MKKYKNALLLSLLSFMSIPIWGLTFLDIDNAGPFSVFIGITFTCYAILLIKDTKLYQSVDKPRGYLVVGPVFYLLASTFLFFDKPTLLLTNPILWAAVLLLVPLFVIKFNFYKQGIVTLFFIYFYSFHLYPIFQSFEFSPNKTESPSLVAQGLSDSVNLFDFDFIDPQLDTVAIPNAKEFLLVETWNEKCGPCMKSIDDLESYIGEFKNVNHIYLYQNFRENNLSAGEIFSFARIKDKQKIRVDVDNRLFQELGINSYPYFLLFDSEGNLVDYFSGYNHNFKSKYEDRISNMLTKKLSLD